LIYTNVPLGGVGSNRSPSVARSHVRGSHHYLRRAGGKLVVVAVHPGETVPPGTLRSILRSAELTVEDLIRLL